MQKLPVERPLGVPGGSSTAHHSADSRPTTCAAEGGTEAHLTVHDVHCAGRRKLPLDGSMAGMCLVAQAAGARRAADSGELQRRAQCQLTQIGARSCRNRPTCWMQHGTMVANSQTLLGRSTLDLPNAMAGCVPQGSGKGCLRFVVLAG